MTPKLKTKKERFFDLLSRGYGFKSPEVKSLNLTGETRKNYHYQWKKLKGLLESQQPKAEEDGNLVSGQEPGVVAVVHQETELFPPDPGIDAGKSQGIESGAGPAGPEEEPEPEDEGEPEKLEEVSPPDGAKKDDEKEASKKPPSGVVVGQGLTFAVTISVKTLMLYQIAASKQEDPLSFGDFVDACVEDTYMGRGYDVGLIRIGGNGHGRKEGVPGRVG